MDGKHDIVIPTCHMINLWMVMDSRLSADIFPIRVEQIRTAKHFKITPCASIRARTHARAPPWYSAGKWSHVVGDIMGYLWNTHWNCWLFSTRLTVTYLIYAIQSSEHTMTKRGTPWPSPPSNIDGALQKKTRLSLKIETSKIQNFMNLPSW